MCLFILSPLFNIVFQGLSATQLFGYWQNPQYEGACLSINHGADRRDFLSVLFGFFLLLLSVNCKWLYHHPKLAHLILTGGMMILAIPTIVLAVGLSFVTRY